VCGFCLVALEERCERVVKNEKQLVLRQSLFELLAVELGQTFRLLSVELEIQMKISIKVHSCRYVSALFQSLTKSEDRQRKLKRVKRTRK
jgi:hypothetical protein